MAEETATHAETAASPIPERNKDVAPSSVADDGKKTDSVPAEVKSAVASATESSEKPINGTDTDVEMKDSESAPTSAAAEASTESSKDPEKDAAAPIASDNTEATPTAAAATKPKAPPRRKSTGVPEHKGKKLNRKSSKAQLNHHTAQPGDQFFIKLKGYPAWPCIIASEDMLPNELLGSRPVGATDKEGNYKEAYAEGGKKETERSFPIMYLSTNEFGWAYNKDLLPLDAEKIVDLITPKMRKDLIHAHQLASEQHDLDHYRGELVQFQEELIARQEAEQARLAEIEEAKAAKAAAKKSAKKAKAAEGEDGDVTMEDAEGAPVAKQSKKRKAEGEDTPQRSASVKKTKIKLTNNGTPKAVNGTAKAGKADSAAKPKAKKDNAEPSPAVVEPELTEEEKHARKQKEVLYLRHKLQKGLLTRDLPPKEEDMKSMSEFITKLEGYPDLEVSIIRTTKINKVLKAILKLDEIPKEEEYNFKDRSTTLLEKWNKLLATDDPAASASASAPTNGVNGNGGEHEEDGKSSVNGTKEGSKKEADVKSEENTTTAKDGVKAPEETPVKDVAKVDEESGDKAEAAPAAEETAAA